jgi:Cu/Ag efflux pump CusA
MLTSTLLNLFFIPVLYMIIEGWRERGGAEIHRHEQP